MKFLLILDIWINVWLNLSIFLLFDVGKFYYVMLNGFINEVVIVIVFVKFNEIFIEKIIVKWDS